MQMDWHEVLAAVGFMIYGVAAAAIVTSLLAALFGHAFQ